MRVVSTSVGTFANSRLLHGRELISISMLRLPGKRSEPNREHLQDR
jgi:hypothetical protein